MPIVLGRHHQSAMLAAVAISGREIIQHPDNSQRHLHRVADDGAHARGALAAWLEIETVRLRELPQESCEALFALVEAMRDVIGPTAVTDLREELAQLRFTAQINEELARRDHLTKLGNRRALDERLDLEVTRARRYRRDLGVVLVDVDHLKTVNDSLGHAAGDAVLRSVASRVAASVRATDFIARFGGDELVVVCPETAAPAVADVASKIVAVVGAAPVLAIGNEISISVSAGWATLQAEQNQTELMRDADAALYRSKSAGRGRSDGFSDIR